jgi:hypothetical protein
MDEVKVDLKKKISQLDVIQKDKKKNEDVVLLMSERDFFRSEAIRLNGICQEQLIRFENLRKEYEVKLEEEKTIIRKWKDVENINKQIFLELENNLKIIKKLEKEKKILEKKKGYENVNNNNIAKFNANANANTNSNSNSNSNNAKVNYHNDNNNYNNNENYNENINLENEYENFNMKFQVPGPSPNLYNIYNNFNNSYDKNSSKIKDNKFMNSTLYNSNSEIIEENNINKNNNNNNNFGNSMISFNVKDNSNNNNILINSSNSKSKSKSNSNSNYLIKNHNNKSLSRNQSTVNGIGIEDIDYINQNTASLFESINNKDKEKLEKIIKFIERLKSDLKKEKNRNNKIIAEFNKILLDRKKLEGIFIDCYEETRREIFQRKMRDTMQWKNAFLQSKTNNNSSLPNIDDIKFENFQILDKKKLLENFLLNEEVFELIKNNLGDSSSTKEIKGGSFFPKPNFGENFHNKNNLNHNYNKPSSVKIKNDLKYINDLVRSSNSRSMNFSRTIYKK